MVTLVSRKGQSRLDLVRKLRSFSVCRKMLRIFYKSVVASAIFFSSISSIRASDAIK